MSVQQPSCKFNKMVDCHEEACEVCGWNPKVRTMRVREFLLAQRQAIRVETDSSVCREG